MLLYPDFYRRYGVRRAIQLAAPPLRDLQVLELPKGSLVHFVPEGEATSISPGDPLLRGAKAITYVEHILELSERRGNPRPIMTSISRKVSDFHRKYRMFRKVMDISHLGSNPNLFLVEDYGLLPEIYRYPPNIYLSYNKWHNLQSTLWANVERLGKRLDRQQFIECRVPSLLPSKAMLQKGLGKASTKLLRLFPDHESLFVLELWKWLGVNREESILKGLSEETLRKVNLVWIESGKWVVMNLGLLNDWRVPTSDELKAGAAKKKGLAAVAMSNYLLRMLMLLTDQRSAPEPDAAQAEEEAKVLKAADAPEAPTEGAGDEPAPVAAPSVVKHPEELLKAPVGDETDEVKIDVKTTQVTDLDLSGMEDTHANLQKLDAIIERDLKALDQMREEQAAEAILGGLDADEKQLERSASLVDDSVGFLDPKLLDVPVLKEKTPEESVMQKADHYADLGMISAAEYRRFEKLASSYKTLPDPYGIEKTLAQVVKVPEKDLVVKPVVVAEDHKGLVDPSMAKTTLKSFDAQYVEKVMPKDVAGAVLGLQHAGVAVTGYRVEENVDAMNAYEAHAVQLTPVHGKATTIHFRLPKVDEHGQFTVNGVKYTMAKQRADNPIRKTDAQTVALTSYYGKVFISRSTKKVADYANWITNIIAEIGMDLKDQRVTDMMLSNVYDNYQHVPRIYSILAMRFRSFKSGELSFFLDHETRDTFYAETEAKPSLKKTEGSRFTFIGVWGKERWPIVVDKDNVLYKVVREGSKGNAFDYETLGTMEDILKLDVAKAPRESVEIKVLGKTIPVGIFLAYEMGFDNLLKVLRVKPNRSVGPGERLNLAKDEYAITFEDERFIFTKSSKKEGLILQSLAAWNQTLVNYGVELFNRKAIYLNVLDRSHLGVRYLREMDLLVDLFIDPITAEILAKDKLPGTFVGLVMLACEMLESDFARDETDLEDSRIRGYERFSGAVYNTLVKAIRLQRARGIPNAPIEMHPDAVWRAITSDPSVRIVEESNPIHELKAQEEVTFSGTGGRSARSMVGRTRLFQTNDLGVISEATKDSADVAITTYLTANPQFTDLRGHTARYNPKETGASSLLSTSAMLAPGSDRDD